MGICRCSQRRKRQLSRQISVRPTAFARDGLRRKLVMGQEASDAMFRKVKGLSVDASMCDCQAHIEDKIRWARQMMEVWEGCKGPGNADDALVCKEQKLAEMGVETERVGQASSDGSVEIQEFEGVCGPIETRATQIHESVHERYLKRMNRKHDGDQSAMAADITAAYYAANEVKAYGAELPFYRRMTRVLRRRCP